MLYQKYLSYVPERIGTRLISRHHDDLPAGHYGIDKIKELIAQKYYWLAFRHNVEAYVESFDVCSASKAVRHNFYGDPQSLSVPTHR